ncbi:glycoside hydrolase family 23 protein [Whalleya microplaca]|nr:glycoside hydrolase family 23 protein [Whalleya microplaca]
MSSYKSILLTTLAAAALTSAQTNPDAQGACSTTTGGSNACGPNGSEEWLNTGLKDANGWNPPFLDINSLTHIDLETYYQGVGKSCEQYDAAFRASGTKYGIDPAILAFIAMQESSCNADAGGSTPGLMQCDPGNCQNGQSSCQYPVQDNTDCGANVLKQALDATGGNAVHALGSYNGWFTADDWASSQNDGKGLTEDYPCGKGRNYGDPQNLNYLHETLNGWFQGKDMYGDDADLDGSYTCTGSCSGNDLC